MGQCQKKFACVFSTRRSGHTSPNTQVILSKTPPYPVGNGKAFRPTLKNRNPANLPTTFSLRVRWNDAVSTPCVATRHPCPPRRSGNHCLVVDCGPPYGASAVGCDECSPLDHVQKVASSLCLCQCVARPLAPGWLLSLGVSGQIGLRGWTASLLRKQSPGEVQGAGDGVVALPITNPQRLGSERGIQCVYFRPLFANKKTRRVCKGSGDGFQLSG